jgi:hypothetical protein
MGLALMAPRSEDHSDDPVVLPCAVGRRPDVSLTVSHDVIEHLVRHSNRPFTIANTSVHLSGFLPQMILPLRSFLLRRKNALLHTRRSYDSVSSYPQTLTEAIKAGSQIVLAAGEERSTRLLAVAFAGHAEVRGIDDEGSVY